ncbi:alpha/beta hydrolase [Fundidesulfovibrio butyratiphilus]
MTTPHLVFVHGWGFDATFWRPIRALLSDYPSTALDLGFFGRVRLYPPEEASPLVGVGHSLGVLWLLRQSFFDLSLLVSLAGFTAFTAGPDLPHGAPEAPVRAMRKGLRRDPEGVLRAFYQTCGLPSSLAADIEYADPIRLARGLDGLLTWRQEPRFPIWALAAEDDAVVTPAHTRDAFADTAVRLDFLDSGGHAFPAVRPEETAAFIRQALSQHPWPTD